MQCGEQKKRKEEMIKLLEEDDRGKGRYPGGGVIWREPMAKPIPTMRGMK